MSLDGTLSDFTISNIFLLIDQDHKNGKLKINSTENVEIYFKNGQIIYIRSEKEDIKIFLYRFLINVKGYSNTEIRELEAHYYNNFHLLSDELLKKAYLSINELTTIIQSGIIDIACNIFNYEGGSYHFEPLPSVDRYQFSNIVVPTNFVLLESAKRTDEWVNISEIITDETLFGSNMQLTPKQVHQPLNNFELYVISFVNGRRTVAEIARQVFFARFHVYTALDKALRKGNISLLNRPDSAALPSQINRTPRHRKGISEGKNIRSVSVASVVTTLLFITLLITGGIIKSRLKTETKSRQEEYCMHRSSLEKTSRSVQAAILYTKSMHLHDTTITLKDIQQDGSIRARDLMRFRSISGE
ncbi:MAG: DUF4388 domain-containing protein [Fibrobacterota bacterium]